MATSKERTRIIKGNIIDMIGISVSKKDLLTETATNLLEQYGESITDELKKSLIESGHTASNKLLQSITWNPIIKTAGGKMVLEIVIEDYYQFVNDGRKGKKNRFSFDNKRLINPKKAPGKLPPYDPIAKWLPLKPGMSPKKLGFSVKAKGASQTENFKRLVNMIRWGIKKNGIEPTYFYTSVINKNLEKELKENISKSMGRAITIQVTTK